MAPSEGRTRPGDAHSRWTLQIGGQSPGELRQDLSAAGVQLNAYAERWFAWEGLQLSPRSDPMDLEAHTLQELGFPQGATLPEVLKRAADRGLAACPLEVGPYLRLAYRDQEEAPSDREASAKGAPKGAVTLAPRVTASTDGLPCGFYLRRVEGCLWLRGFRADDLHVWDAEDILVFRRDP